MLCCIFCFLVQCIVYLSILCCFPKVKFSSLLIGCVIPCIAMKVKRLILVYSTFISLLSTWYQSLKPPIISVPSLHQFFLLLRAFIGTIPPLLFPCSFLVPYLPCNVGDNWNCFYFVNKGRGSNAYWTDCQWSSNQQTIKNAPLRQIGWWKLSSMVPISEDFSEKPREDSPSHQTST